MNTRKIGTAYEEKAAAYLREKGFEILEKNYRKARGEIDLIARDRDYLVFIEVKYREALNQGGAQYAISRSKQQTIGRIAQWYISEHHIPADTFCRFDAVLINKDELEHIPDAWRL
ncbi:MAG: YraN family protein [Parasporobacterium sp.]|nr:YraN family protein [Parasporobacterium sp.]